jgi:DNA-binding protein YbaB
MTNIDINALMQKMANLQQTLHFSKQSLNSDLLAKEYSATSGDEDIGIFIIMRGDFSVKSLKATDELRKMCVQEPEAYFDVMIDLILAAYSKVKAQIDEEILSEAPINDADIPHDLKLVLQSLNSPKVEKP